MACKKEGITWGGKKTFPKSVVKIVINQVTGSPCLVKIKTPAPSMLKPMRATVPRARTNEVAGMLTAKSTQKS